MADELNPVLTISQKDLEQIVRNAVRVELHAVGLRADDPDQVDEAREDFRFVRRLRKATEGAAHKIGMTILVVLAGGLVSAIGLGIKAMLVKSGGGQ